MCRLLFCFMFLLAVCATCVRAQSEVSGCLPKGIKEDEVVFVKRSGRDVKQITVKQKLKQLKARCRERRLVDSKGRPVYFYRLTGCWGNPPSDYLEILERQRKELSDLKKRYTVIEMTCNPSGEPIP